MEKTLLYPYKTPIVCRYCNKEITRTVLKGFSVICPECGKPVNDLK